MMQIGKLDTFVRGGPELPDEMLPGEDTDQFDSLLNALVVLPTAEIAAGGPPVHDETGWTGFANETLAAAKPWHVQPDDIPVEMHPWLEANSEPAVALTEPNSDIPLEPVDVPPADPPPYSEFSVDQSGLSEFESLPKRRPSRSVPKDGQLFETHPSGNVDIIDPGSKSKKEPGPIETPPIIIWPQGPARSPVGHSGIQGRSLNDIIAAQSSPPNESTPTVSEPSDTLDTQLPTAADIGTSSGEAKQDNGTGNKTALFGSDLKVEKSTVTDAIFERFAVDAENAIRESDIELPVEADAVLEQIEKPILEIGSMDIEKGEPLLLKFRLKPAELGTVEIRLERNSAGKLNIEIQADSDVAAQLLNDSFEQLRESLKDNGWQVDELNIFNRNSAEQGPNHNHRGANGGEKSRFDADSRTETNESGEDSNGSAESAETDPERLVSIRA